MTCSPECHKASRARQTGESRNRTANRKVPPGFHGTSTGYTNYKCGCPKCRRWARDYRQTRRAAEREAAGQTVVTRKTTGRSKAKRSRIPSRRH